jgi:hypothetical protein
MKKPITKIQLIVIVSLLLIFTSSSFKTQAQVIIQGVMQFGASAFNGPVTFNYPVATNTILGNPTAGSLAPVFTTNPNVTSISFGAAPAASGSVRLSNGVTNGISGITTGAATVALLEFDSSNLVRIDRNGHGSYFGGLLSPINDNLLDAGTSGSRFRTGYFGTSMVMGTNLTLSAAVPTITSGFGTSPSITGTASAFRITLGTPVGQTGVVAFNTTFANAPVVQCGDETSIAGDPIKGAPTTTNVTLTFTIAVAADKVSCIVHGF